ncbi:MAG: hypothetical protein ACRCWY_04925 [Cellulosilyticaceae bacterium]
MAYIYPKQSGTLLKYRVYYMYQSKKIYIGLYETEKDAQDAYALVDTLMQGNFSLDDYPHSPLLSYQKFISLANFKNNGKYFNTPIYIEPPHFKYFLDEQLYLLFDMRDLLFIANYRIHLKGNYLYLTIGIRQENLLKRFGIPNHATYGTDYICLNGNRYDLRRSNLSILNHYHGVQVEQRYNVTTYVTRIFLKTYLVVGHYETEMLAAIAYNKAVDLVASTSSSTYEKNEFPFLTRHEYTQLYEKLRVSKRLFKPSPQNRVVSPKLYRGISKDKSGFRATIGFGGRKVYLGIYPTEKRAAQAYNCASLYLYGPDGYTNDISPLTYLNDEQKIASKLLKAGLLKQKEEKA